ncbi:MAG: hypothetical protein HY902_08960 [Deltaproteobacteria bacterium]|nr:hypothetical protein [Deltaproteobacteria bacterium]
MIAQIEPEELQARLQAGEPTVLVVVREPWEHSYCHLAGDVLLPLGELDECADTLQVPPGALVVVYCHHGVRSLHGAAYLQGRGFAPVSSLRGGIDAWSTRVDPRIPHY